MIQEFLEARPQQSLSYRDIQTALKLPAGSTFNNAMTFARRLATQNGNCVGYCYERDGEYVLAFNPNDTQLAAAVARRGKAITGQIVGYVDMLDWGARNAQDPALRRYCAQAAKAHLGAQMMNEALTDMAEDLIAQVAG